MKSWEDKNVGFKLLNESGDRPKSLYFRQRRAVFESQSHTFYASLFVIFFCLLLPLSYSTSCAGSALRTNQNAENHYSHLLFALSGTLHAQELPEDLPDMVVTATRSGEIAKNKLSAAATVYTREDIERLQAKSIPELLRGTAGVDVTQSGGAGQISSVFMRGTNSSHVLVLIDGIKVGSVTAGITQFEFIPIDQIEKVEIIRGPQSSLYGSEAIGGVIQIFTRKGSETQTPKVTLDTGGGSYYTQRTAGSISGKLNNNWYSASVSHFDTDGFNVKQPATGLYGINQPDKDGYKNTAVNARAGHHFDNNAELEASFLHAEGTTHYDGGFQDKTNFVNQVADIMGSLDVMKNWRSSLRLGQSLDYGDSFAPSSNKIASRIDSTRWNASWLNQLTVSENNQFTLGSDYRLDEVDSNTKYTETSRYDVGIFGELHSRVFDDHFLNASVRGDKIKPLAITLPAVLVGVITGNTELVGLPILVMRLKRQHLTICMRQNLGAVIQI